MAKRKTSVELPGAGEVFAFRISDCHFGACCVLRCASEGKAKELGQPSVLIYCSTWSGDSIPDAPNE